MRNIKSACHCDSRQLGVGAVVDLLDDRHHAGEFYRQCIGALSWLVRWGGCCRLQGLAQSTGWCLRGSERTPSWLVPGRRLYLGEDRIEDGWSLGAEERTFAQYGCRGDGPEMEQWIISPTGRSWKITLTTCG